MKVRNLGTNYSWYRLGWIRFTVARRVVDIVGYPKAPNISATDMASCSKKSLNRIKGVIWWDTGTFASQLLVQRTYLPVSFPSCHK